MRRRTRLLALVPVLALSAGALWYWDATRFPADAQRVPGTRVTLRVQADAGPDAALVARGVRAELRYLAAAAGRPLRGAVEARVARGDPCEPFLDPGGGGTGMAAAGWLCVDTLVPVWRTLSATEAATVAAHELVHVWQAELGCLRDADDHEFLWLTEGMATDLAWRAVAPAQAAASIRRFGAFDPRVGELREYERRGGGDPEYGRWHLAVRHLLRSARGGPSALAAFCAAIGGGAPWTEAFAAAFGTPPERFYADFAAALPAYRAGSRPL